MGSISRRLAAGLATVLLTAVAVTVGVVPALSAAPDPQIQSLTNIRTGVHPTFDRIVLDMTPATDLTSATSSSTS